MGIGAMGLIEPNRQIDFCYRDRRHGPGSLIELPGTSFSVPIAQSAVLAD